MPDVRRSLEVAMDGGVIRLEIFLRHGKGAVVMDSAAALWQVRLEPFVREGATAEQVSELFAAAEAATQAEMKRLMESERR